MKRIFTIRNLSGLPILLFLILSIWAILFMGLWKVNDGKDRGVIKYDVISYYSYLPATVIYGDATLGFIEDKSFLAQNKFWYEVLDNGNNLVVTSMGLSFMYAPFFFMAHWLAPVLGQNPDGFSNIYQLMLIISGLFYAFLGLILLRRLLLKYFDPVVTSLVLVAVALGTNLFYYSTREAAMPHSHNFFLITLFVTLVLRWYRNPVWQNSLLLGLVFGLIALVRPSNILLFLFLLLYGVSGWKSFSGRVLFYLQRWYLVLIMLLGFFIPWIPQFLYWKAVTGHYIFFTYAEKGATFYWAHPHIIDSLFSFRKGWLIYTPVMVIALVGMFGLRRWAREWFLALVIYVIAMIYVQSSWWCWWFGGGFGLRHYVSMYPLLAISMAYLLSRLRLKKRPWAFGAITALVLILSAYQLFQTRQFTTKAIHYSGTTFQSYKENFLKLRPTHSSWEMLELPDYNLARLGIHVSYSTGEDKEEWRSLDKVEAKEKIGEEIAADPKLQRQIGRYAEREGLPMDTAMSRVLERMYYRKTN
ncbi:MAG: hypothetical protein E4H10_05010 [Bacteroidia bacterium]|nr:MAG: hypothetical protein E4H10_05010 [Bacteroidia bacterium]